MLLSGPPSDAASSHIMATPGLAVFGAATEDDQIVAGVAGVIKGAIDGSKNPHSTATVLPGTEHGLPMFDKNPSLEPELVSWLKTQLLAAH